MAGLRPAGVAEAVLEATYIANLRHAADRLASIGATVTIKPINSRIDIPGYWLDDIDRDNVGLQLDLYHAQIIQGGTSREAAKSTIPTCSLARLRIPAADHHRSRPDLVAAGVIVGVRKLTPSYGL